jgi:hypothetical protein
MPRTKYERRKLKGLYLKKKYSAGSLERDGSAPVFALSYDDLQEIHTLTGQVCGWRMSLPTKMILQAQEVHRRMIRLNQVKAQNDQAERQTPGCAHDGTKTI